ncbi:Gfo/Idh/MocA family protein [Endozoicomonadaceae bacterium StTr2]
MMTAKTLNWGILGTSFISGVMANAMIKEGRSRLVAVGGRSQAGAEAFAAEYQVEKTYTDYDALINDPEVDIIYIALPNHLHYDFVIKAAEAGKAILCEKSLSIDLKEAQAMAQSVKENDVFFAEGLMYLNHPVVEQLLNLLSEGTIGELKSIQGSYSAAISQFVNPDSKGTIFNLGCYPGSLAFRVIKHMLPELDLTDYRIQSTGRRGQDGNVCETSTQLNFNDKVQVQLHSAEDYGLLHGFRILGSKGYIEMASNPWLPEQQNVLKFGGYEKEVQTLDVTAEGDAYLYQIKRIADAISAGETSLPFPSADINESVTIMHWLDQWHLTASESCS